MSGVTLSVRRLLEGDDRSKFKCGNPDLDRFFLRYAGQNQFRHHIGTTYVAVGEDGIIAGFATITASEISPEAIRSGKSLPRYPIPVLRLARLAVDERFKGAGVGGLLLRSVFSLAKQMASDVGCAGIVVDSKTEAIGFYAKLGFIRLDSTTGTLGDRPEPIPMFLPLSELP